MGVYPEVGREILVRARGAHRLVRAEEMEALGYDHAEIGGMLLRKWKLPPGPGAGGEVSS